uniref:Kazal-like domain-containing protein n=1 Tax=Strigamia maritima TaxID=126957 RepID=T1JKE2_STRMM
MDLSDLHYIYPEVLVISDPPCEKLFCTFGSICVIDKMTNEAYCKCQETCSAVFAPVCGSDDVTYSSECQLRMASCNQQKRILVKYKGSCEFVLTDDISQNLMYLTFILQNQFLRIGIALSGLQELGFYDVAKEQRKLRLSLFGLRDDGIGTLGNRISNPRNRQVTSLSCFHPQGSATQRSELVCSVYEEDFDIEGSVIKEVLERCCEEGAAICQTNNVKLKAFVTDSFPLQVLSLLMD